MASVLRKALCAFRTVAFIFVGVSLTTCMFAPLATTLHAVKTRIREACATLITKFFVTCGRRLNICLLLLQPLVAFILNCMNPLTPNDPYRGRTAPLTSKRYSTNTGTEYFKHGKCSPFLSLQNAVCFIILTYFPVLFTFYIQSVLKFKKIIPAPNG